MGIDEARRVPQTLASPSECPRSPVCAVLRRRSPPAAPCALPPLPLGVRGANVYRVARVSPAPRAVPTALTRRTPRSDLFTVMSAKPSVESGTIPSDVGGLTGRARDEALYQQAYGESIYDRDANAFFEVRLAQAGVAPRCPAVDAWRPL